MTKIFVKTFGCSANFSDSEIMQGLLEKAEFEIINHEEDADLIIINICTVKGDNTALKEIRKIHEQYPYKKIIISGCITEEIIPKIQEILPDNSFISTHNIKQIVEVVEETFHNNPVSILVKEKCEKILLPRIRKNKVIGIVQIATGCINACSYCSTKLIKGKLFSFAPEKIVEDIKVLIADGCKEIWLTSQDNSCYGFDINTNIVELLKKVCAVEGDFFIRLGMSNPKQIKEYTSELVSVFKHPKMFKFLHIPVQSGNNEILKKMKRGYTVEEFEKIIQEFQKEIPEITISTDVIAGFPTETKEQFQDTVELIKKIKPAVLNISRFIPREKTKAFDMKEQVSAKEKKDRSRILSFLHEWISLEVNRKWKKWEGEILIDEEGKEGTIVGRNFAYRPVVIKKSIKIGEKIKVKITNISSHYLIGESSGI